MYLYHVNYVYLNRKCTNSISGWCYADEMGAELTAALSAIDKAAIIVSVSIKQNGVEIMKWSDFESRIKPEMLNGRAFTLTVSAVEIESVLPRPGQPREDIPVLHFAETTKTLVLNKTNRRILARAWGDDAAAAIGQRVTLTPCQVNSSKGKQPGITITPAATQPAPEEVDTTTGEIAAAPAKPTTCSTPAPTMPAAAPAASALDAHFGPNLRQVPAPAPTPTADPGAARKEFYAIAGEAIRTGKLTAQAVNEMVRTANGGGFAAALEMIREETK